MIYDINTIKADLKSMDARTFFTKHILKSNNWYFEEYMKKNPEDVLSMIDEYRLIISEALCISFNSIMMVGSGKVGVSLTPPSKNPSVQPKLFQPFNDDESVRNKSDIDIAIISSELFNRFWNIFRNSYKVQYESTYRYLYNAIYRGYINEKSILTVDSCRKEWMPLANSAKKRLSTDLYIKNEVSFRIYRNWEDFDEYNLQNISVLKRSLDNEL